MQSTVPTVVFPVAGLGTRILPATKTLPKELLPLVDRPVIQCGVEEAVASGIDRVVLVTSPNNTMTAAYFEANPRLEDLLEKRGKTDALKAVRAVTTMAEVTTVHQADPLGLGHAVLMAKHAVNDTPFAVALPDDVIDADPPALRQMRDLFDEFTRPIFLPEELVFDGVDIQDVYPRGVDLLAVGQELFQVGLYRGGGDFMLKLNGRVQDDSVSLEYPLEFTAQDTAQGLIPRLWAHQKVQALEAEIARFGPQRELGQVLFLVETVQAPFVPQADRAWGCRFSSV